MESKKQTKKEIIKIKLTHFVSEHLTKGLGKINSVLTNLWLTKELNVQVFDKKVPTCLYKRYSILEKKTKI